MKKRAHRRQEPFRETDLALERRRASGERRGITYKEAAYGEIRFTALTVGKEAVASEMPCGRTLSVSFPTPFFFSEAEKEETRNALRLALQAFFPTPPSRLLVAGLGNRRLTADSLGPLTAERVEVSAALPKALAECFGIENETRVAVCVPDVFARTGIESVRSVEAAARLFEADALLAFDALAARDKERLFRVVEFTDTGTVPGGGVKRGTLTLSQKTLGIPVVAVGVPTVVRADGAHFLVPSDMEECVEALASLLAEAVNLHFGGALPVEGACLEELFEEETL